MFRLDVPKKSGFKISDVTVPVIIYDSRGKVFYNTINREPRVKVFNLPKGKYFTDNWNFVKLDKPIPFKIPNLPRPQRNKKFPVNFTSIVGNNPNKCSIFWNKHIILWDSSMLGLTLPELYFILFHEFAHARYKDEDLADLAAAKYMLQKGFNPSQIVRSPITSLSGNSFDRKLKLYRRMLDSRYEN